MEQRVLVASNRGPVSYEFGADGNLTSKRGGGGLIAGLTSGLAAVGSGDQLTWICAALSDADRAAARQQDGAGVNGSPELPVCMLDIPQHIFEGAYNSVANAALWFVHHMLFDTPNQPQFGLAFRQDWDAYVDYNRAFADALVAQAGHRPVPPGGVRALIQDYHLALAPRMLRDRADGRSPGLRIAHFSHTPWAPPAYYQMLPDEAGRAVLDGMLGADHVGFLCDRWAAAFLDCCQAFLGADVDLADPVAPPDPLDPLDPLNCASGTAGPLARVSYRDHVTEVAVHPLGVDAPALRARAQADDVRAHIETLGRAAAGRRLIVRVDRTELSKNIVRGLAAYRELLVTRPDAAARAADQRGVWHGGLESADPGGEGRLPPVARRLRAGGRAACEPDQGRHEPGRAGGPRAVRARLRASALPRGGRGLDARRRRADRQPLRHQRDRRGPARGPAHARRRTPAPQRRPSRHRRLLAPRPLARRPASLPNPLTPSRPENRPGRYGWLSG